MNLLSIVIPTYNRVKLLENTLNGLELQISIERFNDIEIVISDNASPDNTENAVKKWIESHKNLNVTYSRNVENVGFDRNCDVGARAAKGKFVWFMSDDDSLVVGAVEKAFQALSRNSEVTFAFVNYSMLTPGFDEYFPYKFSHDLVLSADDFIVESKLGFSFITACIFNRDAWCSLDLKNYIGTHWMQLYAAKDAATMGKSLIIAEPLIKMRREGLQESRREKKNPNRKIDMFMEYHLSFLDFLETFKNSKYSKQTVEKIKDFGWNDNLGQILSLKLTSDQYKTEEIKIIFGRMKKYFSHKLVFWSLHVPLLFLPKLFSQIYFAGKMQIIKLKKVLRPYLKRDQVKVLKA